MKKTWWSLLFLATVVVALSITKSFWWPSGLSEKWHRAWLSAPSTPSDARQLIIEDHERQKEAIRVEYETKIEDQKRVNEKLLAEYEDLKYRKATP